MSDSIVRAPADELRGQLRRMEPEFKSALPSHIRPEKLVRVVMTVVQQTPELLQADRTSLLASCTKCAADGLVPDGREAALVIFNTKEKTQGGGERWVKKVQYLPMLTGIIKRARNTGEIAGIVVNVVYAADKFERHPEDFDHPITHQPPPLGQPRGAIVGAYALAKLRDGTIMHEVMDTDEIEKVRKASRAGDSGPWKQWYEEMARKTVFRRLSKYLPMNSEVDDLIRRDDEISGPVMLDGGDDLDVGPAAPPGKGNAALRARLTSRESDASSRHAEATDAQTDARQAINDAVPLAESEPPTIDNAPENEAQTSDPFAPIEGMPFEVISRRATSAVWKSYEKTLTPDQQVEANLRANGRVEEMRVTGG